MEYIGFDVHKQFSVACILNDSTGEIRHQNINNTSAEFASLAAASKNSKVVLEAGRSAYMIYDIIEDMFDEILMANPLKIKAISHAAIKTDKVDAETLARLLKADFIPQSHIRSKENREVLYVLRQRMFFVKIRTMLKNRMHALIDRQSEEVRMDRPPRKSLFTKVGVGWMDKLELSPFQTDLLRQMLNSYHFINEMIRQSNELIRTIFNSDPVAQLLESIPGIGMFLAVLIRAEIDEIHRFPSSKKLMAYSGLAPTTHSSGGRTWHGKLIKCSNRHLKYALIEAVWPAVRSNFQIKNYYEKLKKQKAVNMAKAATAGYLLKIVYRVWTQNQGFTLTKPSSGKKRNTGRPSVHP